MHNKSICYDATEAMLQCRQVVVMYSKKYSGKEPFDSCVKDRDEEKESVKKDQIMGPTKGISFCEVTEVARTNVSNCPVLSVCSSHSQVIAPAKTNSGGRFSDAPRGSSAFFASPRRSLLSRSRIHDAPCEHLWPCPFGFLVEGH